MIQTQKNSASDDTALSTTDARMGTSGLGVRYVLAISTLGAAALMGIVYLFFLMN
jgi:hypothetical protein